MVACFWFEHKVMGKQSLYLWLLWYIRAAGKVGGWVGGKGTYEESYLKFPYKRLVAKDINGLLHGVSFAVYKVPGQNEVLWLNFMCSRNQAPDLRNLHKLYITCGGKAKSSYNFIFI